MLFQAKRSLMPSLNPLIYYKLTQAFSIKLLISKGLMVQFIKNYYNQ